MTGRRHHLYEIDVPVLWDEAERDAAARIGSHHFHAYLLFTVPRGTWASSPDEDDLVAQMRRIEVNVKARSDGTRNESGWPGTPGRHVPPPSSRAARAPILGPTLAARAPQARMPDTGRRGAR
jgi:hypothetical protein